MGDSNSTKPQQEQPDDPFTCEICNEPVLSNNSLCVHPFRKLNECIRSLSEYLQFKNEEERVAEIKCPGSNCDKLLDPLTCPPALVPPEVSDRCYCPNRVCSALVVKECGGIVKKSMCPNCKHCVCRCYECGREVHQHQCCCKDKANNEDT